MIKNIFSKKELDEELLLAKEVFLLLYKSGSEVSHCALENLKEVDVQGRVLLLADVNEVKDIHSEYNIDTIPSLLTFSDAKYAKLLKGCHSVAHYESTFKNEVNETASASAEAKPDVLVYTTPVCSYCTTIKNYLRVNNVSYREVDVSKDQNAAMEMKNRSGQQGVPQTYVNGKLVMGFDKVKLDDYLGL